MLLFCTPCYRRTINIAEYKHPFLGKTRVMGYDISSFLNGLNETISLNGRVNVPSELNILRW